MIIQLKNEYIYLVENHFNEARLLEQDETYRYYQFSTDTVSIDPADIIETIPDLLDLGYKMSKKHVYVRDDEPGYIDFSEYQNTDEISDNSYYNRSEAESTFRNWIPKSKGEKRFKRTIQELEKQYS